MTEARGRIPAVAFLVGGAFFMELLDGSVITTALPRMARSFGVDAVALNPGVSAYLLAVAVFILPSGWMAERWGARRVFTAAVALFTAASVLCALCSSAPAFIACRVLQGVGGAMMVPVGRLVVLRSTAKADLIRAIAVLTWPGLTAPVLGPPLGGFIAEYFSWHWIFLINLPLGLLGIVLSLWLVPEGRGAARPFDWAGFALGGAAVVVLTLGLDRLGALDADWHEGAATLASAALLAVLAVRHLRRTAHPLVGLQPFAVPTFRTAMLGGSAMRILISAMPFLLPLLFQLGFGLDPLRAGLLVLWLFAGNVGIKPLTTPILRRWRFRHILLVNGLLQAACMALCALLSPSVPEALVAALLAVAGASRSMQFTALNTLAFAEVPAEWMGTANTLFSLAFQFSNGMGVAVGAALLQLTGSGGQPGFVWTFATLAGLMVLASLSALGVAPGAAGAVAGRRA